MMKLTKFNFSVHGGGKLVAIEGNQDVPFDIKRIYYIHACNEQDRRGFHAHKNLRQVLFAIHGSCKLDLDDGQEKMAITLDSPFEGIYIDRPMWREIYHFTNDCILMVLASEHYAEDDYIRNYDDFIKFTKRENNVYPSSK